MSKERFLVTWIDRVTNKNGKAIVKANSAQEAKEIKKTKRRYNLHVNKVGKKFIL